MNLTGTPGIPVSHIRKIWSPNTDGRRIDLSLANGQQLTVPVGSVEEFLALSLVCTEPHVGLLPGGTLVGWR